MADTPSDAEVVRLAARAHEHDRYLSALLAPRTQRDALIALAAFAGEVARVPSFVSEPMIGEIRLQWWRDTMEAQSALAITSGNPIADAFGAAMRTHGLPAAPVEACVDGHAERLVDTPFADTQALLDNLDATEGSLFELALRIGSVETDLASAAGRAYGLARLIAELPITLSQGKILLPLDRLAAHGIEPDALRKDEAGGRLSPLLAEISGRAISYADDLARRWPTLTPQTRSALRPSALVRPYLALSQRQTRSVFEVRDIAPLTRVWRLWRGGYPGGI